MSKKLDQLDSEKKEFVKSDRAYRLAKVAQVTCGLGTIASFFTSVGILASEMSDPVRLFGGMGLLGASAVLSMLFSKASKKVDYASCAREEALKDYDKEQNEDEVNNGEKENG